MWGSTMKNIIYILTIFVMVSSCKDSLGLDPNPTKEYIDKPPYEDKSFAPDSMVITVTESYNFSSNQENWDKQTQINQKDIRIDTSSIIPRVWISLEIANLKTGPGFPARQDWITLLKTRVDSVEAFGTYLLTEPNYKGKWLSLDLFEYSTSETQIFSERQIDSKLKFYGYDDVKHEIFGAIESSFFNNSIYETNSILVTFRIYY
jgi:hypothetical protein